MKGFIGENVAFKRSMPSFVTYASFKAITMTTNEFGVTNYHGIVEALHAEALILRPLPKLYMSTLYVAFTCCRIVFMTCFMNV